MLRLDGKSFRYAAWGVLGVILVLILVTFRDYGITWDEELQSQYGRAVKDYYMSGFRDMSYAEIFNLYLYGGMFDGLAAIVDNHTPFFIYDTRHLLNALFGLLGLWGVWKLGRLLGGEVAGLAALVLCAVTPSYYGHMFNNPKDIPFAVGIVWTIYFMSKHYAKPTTANLIKLGVVFGLTLGVRVGGAMLFAFWLAPLKIVALRPWFEHRSVKTAKKVLSVLCKRSWREFLPAGLLSYAVMLICWPWAQQSPVLNPLRALGEFSNFPQDVEVLLDGVTYRSTELPWYYVPLYFGVQLPEALLLLAVLSFVGMPFIWKGCKTHQKQGLALVLLMMLVPVLYAVFRHPALYDAVRHFLFVVPLLCVIAALGLRSGGGWLLGRVRRRFVKRWVIAVFAGAAFAVIALQVVVMARLHPYEYIYANSFAGGAGGAFGRYESDYWGSSFKEAAQELQRIVASEGGVPPGKIYKVAICGPWSAATIYLPPNYDPVEADKPAEFFLSTTRWMCHNMRPGREVVEVKRMGALLSVVKDLRGGYEYYEGNEHEKKEP